MKTRITLLFLLISAVCLAQNFEGTIKWSMTSEITDPKMKAQMEEAQKKMNDPATQAQMKQMQAVMDSNPQMKAQMENAMKMMQGGNMNSMFPTGFTVKVKNSNTLTVMQGGMMDGTETLYLKDKSQSYMINRASKTYSVFHHNQTEASKKQGEVKITKTKETQKILNYNCTKTIVTITEKGTVITQIFWTTTEFKGFDLKGLSKQGTGSNYSMFYENMEGVPLKMEMTTPQAKMVMQVTEIKKESVPAAAFEVPTGFTETKLPGQF